MTNTDVNSLEIIRCSEAQFDQHIIPANSLALVEISATPTEVNYLSGATSNIQTQLDSKLTGNNTITGATKTKITYDSKGLVTGGADLASSDVTTALGFTPYNNTNPSNYQTNVLEGVQINSTDLTITSKKVNIPLASTSDLGVVKVDGTSITITNGVISSSGGSGGIETEVW